MRVGKSREAAIAHRRFRQHADLQRLRSLAKDGLHRAEDVLRLCDMVERLRDENDRLRAGEEGQ